MVEGAGAFPILMYHALWPALDDERERDAHFAADPQLRDPGARLYALDVRQFDEQMAVLAEAGTRTPRCWADVRPDAPGGDARRAWITFDDGHVSNHTLALPVLRRHDLTGIFFVTSDWIDRPGFMTPDQLRELAADGMLIGAHGATHRYFSDLGEEALRDELSRSRARLEEILEAPVPAVALPGGRSHPSLHRLAREVGYTHVFTSTLQIADENSAPNAWPRIAITQQQDPEFVRRLISGDHSDLLRMERRQRLLGTLKRVMGNRVYDWLRGMALRDEGPN